MLLLTPTSPHHLLALSRSSLPAACGCSCTCWTTGADAHSKGEAWRAQSPRLERFGCRLELLLSSLNLMHIVQVTLHDFCLCIKPHAGSLDHPPQLIQPRCVTFFCCQCEPMCRGTRQKNKQKETSLSDYSFFVASTARCPTQVDEITPKTSRSVIIPREDCQ